MSFCPHSRETPAPARAVERSNTRATSISGDSRARPGRGFAPRLPTTPPTRLPRPPGPWFLGRQAWRDTAETPAPARAVGSARGASVGGFLAPPHAMGATMAFARRPAGGGSPSPHPRILAVSRNFVNRRNADFPADLAGRVACGPRLAIGGGGAGGRRPGAPSPLAGDPSPSAASPPDAPWRHPLGRGSNRRAGRCAGAAGPAPIASGRRAAGGARARRGALGARPVPSPWRPTAGGATGGDARLGRPGPWRPAATHPFASRR